MVVTTWGPNNVVPGLNSTAKSRSFPRDFDNLKKKKKKNPLLKFNKNEKKISNALRVIYNFMKGMFENIWLF